VIWATCPGITQLLSWVKVRITTNSHGFATVDQPELAHENRNYCLVRLCLCLHGNISAINYEPVREVYLRRGAAAGVEFGWVSRPWFAVDKSSH